MKLTGSAFAAALMAAMAMSAGCTDKEPRKHMEAAQIAMAKNDYKTASIEVKNSLQADPELPEARFMLGGILLKQGDPRAAEVEFRKALAAGHPVQKVAPELAKAMLTLGQHTKLVDEYGKSVFNAPDADSSLQTSLAVAYTALGKPEQAQLALTSALAANPQYAPASLIAATLQATLRNYDAALQMVEKILSKDVSNAEAWKLKGDLLSAKNLPAAALDAYRKATTIDPSFTPANAAAFAVLMGQGQLDEAAKELARLKATSPDGIQTKYLDARLSFARADYKGARELITQLLVRGPNSPDLLLTAGAVELQTNSLFQAEAYLTRAVQAAPGFVPAQKLLLMTFLRSGHPEKALAALNAFYSGREIAPDLYSVAGEAYLQSGDARKAEEYFSKALSSDSGNPNKRAALATARLAGADPEGALIELQAVSELGPAVTADLILISELQRRKEFEKALKAIDKLEAKQPDRPLAADLRGRALLAMNDSAAARKSFEQALKVDPTYFSAVENLASLDLKDKKPDEAKKRFEQLLAINPRNATAWQALARLSAARGEDPEEASKLLAKAVAANQDDISSRLMLIEHFVRTKDNGRAMSAAQDAVARMPDSPDLTDALGVVQQASGNFSGAIVTFAKVGAMEPLSPRAQLRIAAVQMASRDNLAAEQSLRKALEIQPSNLEAQRQLIQLSVELKKFTEASRIAKAVQAQLPKSAAGFTMEADVAAAQKDWDGAAAGYRAGLSRDASSELAIKLNMTLLGAGRINESNKFIASWVKDHPNDSNFRIHVGDIAMTRADFLAAESNYLAVLKLQPDNPIVLNNLAEVTGKLRKEGSLAYAERANALAPNQPAFMDTLASLLVEKNQISKAIDLQAKALKLQPANYWLRFNLAKMYIKSGDKIRAKEELEVLARLGLKFPEHLEVSALLKTV